MFTAEDRDAWSRVPVDDVGYVSSAELLALPDNQLRALIADMEVTRYKGWRNHRGGWVSWMALDRLPERVLDFGCGTGIEALQYARRGHAVSVTDICDHNVVLAERVLALHGYRPERAWVQAPGGDVILRKLRFDAVHMAGVLHHIREPVPVIREVARHLPAGGQLRLMVYSDQGWRIATGTEPPAEVTGHEAQERFTRFFDAVGSWADWYDEDRLRERFGTWFGVTQARYITRDRRYLTAVLTRHDSGGGG